MKTDEFEPLKQRVRDIYIRWPYIQPESEEACIEEALDILDTFIPDFDRLAFKRLCENEGQATKEYRQSRHNKC